VGRIFAFLTLVLAPICLGLIGESAIYVLILCLIAAIVSFVGLLIDNARGRQTTNFTTALMSGPIAIASSFALNALVSSILYSLSSMATGHSIRF
jgi:uncharacterized membrane protein